MLRILTSLILLSFLCTRAPAQELTPAVIGQELDRMISALETYHPNTYHYTSATEIAALRNEIVSGLPAAPTMKDGYRAATRLACAFGDGHTRVYDHSVRKAYRTAGGTYFPLAVTANAGGLTIRADYRGLPDDLTGRRIVAINAVPAARLLADMSRFASRETPELDLALLSSNFRHYLWLTYDWATGDFPLTLADGTRLTVRGLTAGAIAGNQPAIAPEPRVAVNMVTESTVHLRITDFNGRPKAFRKLFRKTFRKINESGATHLILDLRGHDGGDSRVGEDLARYLAAAPFRQFAYHEWKATAHFKEAFKQVNLPGSLHWMLPALKGINPHTRAIYSTPDGELARVVLPPAKPYGNAFKGKVTLLTDNNTFSAGTCFAAMFKDNRMGTIVGQQTGNLANFHADAILPLSLFGGRLRLKISTSYLVRPNGDETPVPVQPDVVLAPGVDALEFVISRPVGELTR